MDPSVIGELDNIWGRHVLETTWCPEGTAVVMDSNLAARWYLRQSMDVQSNPWGDTEWQTNTVSFRAEERATLAIRYPQAISIVVGLPSDSGVS
jgi:Phage capsid family